ncbi:MAG: DUF1588 domain-containing protein, partial [Myxococcota bacterium]
RSMFGPALDRKTIRRPSVPRLVTCLTLALVGCTGVIGGDEGDGDRAPPSDTAEHCSSDPSFSVPLARINRAQFETIVTDLFGAIDVPGTFPAPLRGYLYTTYAGANPVGETEVDAIMDVAEAIGMQVVDQVPPCTDDDEPACARRFLRSLADRAFRRAVSDEELSRLTNIYAEAKTDADHAESVGIAVSALLQMPAFLYALENVPEDGSGAATPLTGEEIAQRIGLLYLNGLPDEALLEAAAADTLLTAEGRGDQVRRLLTSGQASGPLAGFLRQWLHLEGETYDQFEPEVLDALWRELELLLQDALTRQDGLSRLLSSSQTRVNSTLEGFYGLPSTSRGPDDWIEVDLPPEQRVGILTHPLLMASLSIGDTGSVIKRGHFVRTRLLCGEISSPPAGAVEELDEIVPPGASPRERAEARLDNGRCGGCHQWMDPIGLGLSAFDGHGRYDATADTRGSITAHAGLAEEILGEFDGARALGERLAASPAVRACFARNWVRYAMGRTESREESCSMGELTHRLSNQSLTMQSILTSFVETRAFAERYSAPILEEDSP